MKVDRLHVASSQKHGESAHAPIRREMVAGARVFVIAQLLLGVLEQDFELPTQAVQRNVEFEIGLERDLLQTRR